MLLKQLTFYVGKQIYTNIFHSYKSKNSSQKREAVFNRLYCGMNGCRQVTTLLVLESSFTEGRAKSIDSTYKTC